MGPRADAGDIVGYRVEEVYELADAIAAGDLAAEHGELGDLLLQVVLLALMLSEQDAGDLASVARDIEVKLIRRHPHIFADAVADTPAQVKDRWERIKVEQEGREGIFHDVPAGLPALLYARKLQQRAAERRLRLGLRRGGVPQDRGGARRTGGAVRRGRRRCDRRPAPRRPARRARGRRSALRDGQRRAPAARRPGARPARGRHGASSAGDGRGRSSPPSGTVARSTCPRRRQYYQRAKADEAGARRLAAVDAASPGPGDESPDAGV